VIVESRTFFDLDVPDGIFTNNYNLGVVKSKNNLRRQSMELSIIRRISRGKH